MVQNIHSRSVICIQSIPPHAGHLSEKNDDLAVQFQDVHRYIKSNLVPFKNIEQNWTDTAVISMMQFQLLSYILLS